LSSNPSLNEVFPDSSVVVSSSAGEILNMVASEISAASFDDSVRFVCLSLEQWSQICDDFL
jgi:hypothetical protein